MQYDGLPFVDLDPDASDMFSKEKQDVKCRRNIPKYYLKLVLTDELIAAITPHKNETWISDAICKNLVLRCRPCGSISYYLYDYDSVYYETEKESPMVRILLGSVKDYSVAEARLWVTKMVERKNYLWNLSRTPKIPKTTPIADLIQLYLSSRGTEDFSRTINSKTYSAIESLLVEHIAPKYGKIPVSKVKRMQWLLLIEKVRLRRTSRGIHLHKALKTFLNWCVAQGILEGNPIARTATGNPFQKDRRGLRAKDLYEIYGACIEMNTWIASNMLRLIILTGEPLKWIKVARYEAINQNKRTWAIEYRIDYKTVVATRKIALSEPGLQIIEDLGIKTGLLFKSPRNPNAHINVSNEFMRELRERSGIKGEWGAREVKTAARRLIDDPQGPNGNLEAWAKLFIDGFEEAKNPADDEVAL